MQSWVSVLVLKIQHMLNDIFEIRKQTKIPQSSKILSKYHEFYMFLMFLSY